jgi:hypothetical protein
MVEPYAAVLAASTPPIASPIEDVAAVSTGPDDSGWPTSDTT